MTANTLPAKYDIRAYRGDRTARPFGLFNTVWDETLQKWVKGTAISLAGSTVRAQIRDEEGVLKASFLCDVKDQNTSTGRVDLILMPAVSRTLEPGSYFYDLEVTGADPTDVRTYVAGTLSIKGDHSYD